MRAAVMDAVREPLVVRDLPDPDCATLPHPRPGAILR